MTNDNETIWWFGGGTDLTPYILSVEDCCHFHKVLKICCDKFDKNFYRTFKKACDEYFYLDHRGLCYHFLYVISRYYFLHTMPLSSLNL